MIFSLHQLQENCREQNQPLNLAFIDLIKTFDLVSRDGLFKMLPLIGCPPKLLSIARSLHDSMMSTVQFDGNVSAEFGVKSGVKQGCVLTPTLFGIFFTLLLKHAFMRSTDGVCLHSRSDGCLFNISQLHAKTKTRTVTIRDLLFADDTALVSHQQDGLQRLMDKFSDACDLFSLTISQKKTQVKGKATPTPPCITVSGKELEVVSRVASSPSGGSGSLSPLGPSGGGPAGIFSFYSMPALFHLGNSTTSGGLGIECLQPSLDFSGKLCVSFSSSSSSGSIKVSGRTCQRSTQTFDSGGALLDGGSLASHSSQHVGRCSLVVAHHKDLIMDVLVSQVLKGLPYLHLTLWQLSNVCYTDRGSLPQSVRQWQGQLEHLH